MTFNPQSLIGMRVEMPAWSDQWMQGDRFGEIVKVNTKTAKDFCRVKLDKSGRVIRVHLDALQPI